MIRVRDIDHVVLRVRDVDKMIAFYEGVLGCAVERRRDDLGLVHLRAGRAMVDLVPLDSGLRRNDGRGVIRLFGTRSETKPKEFNLALSSQHAGGESRSGYFQSFSQSTGKI